jgi:hypothetical protein
MQNFKLLTNIKMLHVMCNPKKDFYFGAFGSFDHDFTLNEFQKRHHP